MPTKKKIGKSRLDKYYHLAKDQGFRARSAYKLIQINQKHNFLTNTLSLVDLCCAPGSWLQVASQHNITTIIGVDIVPVKPITGVKTIVGDITNPSTLKEIFNISGDKIDVVLCDGAPNIGTCWEKDSFEQNALILSAIEISSKILKKNGTFITKVFRSKDYFNLLFVLNQLFEDVQTVKPLASRDISAEIFLICKKYKKPFKIDSSFFDPNKVFKEKVENVNFYKVINFSDFFKHNDPKSVLQTHSKIIIDVNHEQFDKVFDNTTKIFFDDLQQLNKNEIRKILRKNEKLKKLIRNGLFIKNLEVDVRGVEVEDNKENIINDNKLMKLEKEIKKEKRKEKRMEMQRKIRIGQSKVFERLSSIDTFFDDKLFKKSVSQESKGNIKEGRKEGKEGRKEEKEEIKGNIKEGRKEGKEGNIKEGIQQIQKTRQIKESIDQKEIQNTNTLSDDESFSLDEDDKHLLIEMQNDKESFLQRTVNKHSLNDTSTLPKFYTIQPLKPNDVQNNFNFQNINKKQKEYFNRKVRRALKFKKEKMEEIKDENELIGEKRVFKNLMRKRNNRKKVVVSRKGRPGRRVKGRVVYVDRRMKKELRKSRVKN